MSNASTEEERYPVGRFEHAGPVGHSQRGRWIEDLKTLPAQLEALVLPLSGQQLDTPYRAAGWTVRQVVHHLPDSHMNSYVRFRLALTETAPLIRPYQEDRWAELSDARLGPIAPSLQILNGLHARWTALLSSLDNEHFARTFTHPDLGQLRLDWTLGLYAWHGRHHLAQIASLGHRMGWW